MYNIFSMFFAGSRYRFVQLILSLHLSVVRRGTRWRRPLLNLPVAQRFPQANMLLHLWFLLRVYRGRPLRSKRFVTSRFLLYHL